MPQLLEITGADGAVVQPDWLARAEPVHRQLRPQLPGAYAAALRDVFAHGARMTLAIDQDRVTALAVFRLIVNTAHGRELYVDDLVTDEARRSQGHGKALLAWLAERARSLDCRWLTLDSGTQRHAAHRFYFRAGMTISSFHFVRTL